MKCLAILVFLFWATAPAFSAEEEEVEKGELLSRYWLAEPVTLAATIGLPNHLFSLSVPGQSDDKLKNVDYSPPQSSDLTIAAGYGPFQFSWKFPLPPSAANKATYGDNEYNDLNFEYGRDRYAASAYFQSFRGFYTDLNGNTGNFARIDSGGGGSATDTTSASTLSAPQDILKRPDIRTRHYGVIGWYGIPLVGENAQAFQISFHSLFDSPSPGFNLDLATNIFYDRSQIHGGLPLIPSKKASLFPASQSLWGLDLHSAGAGTGLATSYVFQSTHFFLDGLFTYGGGVQRQRAEYLRDTHWTTAYVDNVNFRFGVNYQAELKKAGLHLWVNTLGSRVGDARVNSSNMAIELNYQQTI